MTKENVWRASASAMCPKCGHGIYFAWFQEEKSLVMRCSRCGIEFSVDRKIDPNPPEIRYCPHCGGQETKSNPWWQFISCDRCGRVEHWQDWREEPVTPVTPQKDAFRKDDDGKLKWHLVPLNPLGQVVRVCMMGAKQYGEGNWKKGCDWSRLWDAAMRHLTAFQVGEDWDRDSQLPHLAHAAWNMLVLMEYARCGLGKDDRENRGA